jgi:hypothetical protein
MNTFKIIKLELRKGNYAAALSLIFLLCYVTDSHIKNGYLTFHIKELPYNPLYILIAIIRGIYFASIEFGKSVQAQFSDDEPLEIKMKIE